MWLTAVCVHLPRQHHGGCASSPQPRSPAFRWMGAGISVLWAQNHFTEKLSGRILPSVLRGKGQWGKDTPLTCGWSSFSAGVPGHWKRCAIFASNYLPERLVLCNPAQAQSARSYWVTAWRRGWRTLPRTAKSGVPVHPDAHGLIQRLKPCQQREDEEGVAVGNLYACRVVLQP